MFGSGRDYCPSDTVIMAKHTKNVNRKSAEQSSQKPSHYERPEIVIRRAMPNESALIISKNQKSVQTINAKQAFSREDAFLLCPSLAY